MNERGYTKMEWTNSNQTPAEEQPETNPVQPENGQTEENGGQNRDAGYTWTSAADDKESTVSKVIGVINELKDIVAKAPKTLIKAGVIKIDEKELSERLELLVQLMHSAVSEADRIVRRKDQILAEAKGKSDDMMNTAKQNADAIAAQAETSKTAVEHQIDAAKGNLARIQAEGEALRKQKEQEADQRAQSIINDARARADQMLRTAHQQQEELVSREAVYHRAEVEANELLEKNKAQIEQMRQKTFSYLDELLGQGENYLGSVAFNVNNLAQNIHNERENLSSRR